MSLFRGSRKYASWYIGSFCIAGSLFLPSLASAAILSRASDLISDSTPLASTTIHTITFSNPQAIPGGGKIVITPNGSGGFSFSNQVGLDFSDMTFTASSGGGPFIPRNLSAAPSPTDDGVAVVLGANGTITITLASGSPIPAGSDLSIVVGNVHFITSPALATSYRIRIETRDASDVRIDNGTAMIAIVQPVTLDAGAGNIIPPIRSNGLPSGLLPGSTVSVWVSLNTDVPATCKYSSSSGVAFFAMSSSTILTKANLGLLHYMIQPVAENDIFSYYVRCMNDSNISNTDDYLITFEVGVIPNASSTPAPPAPPPSPSGGGSSGGGGGGGLFLQQGQVTLSGTAIPSGMLIITKDGLIVKEEQVSQQGSFSHLFTGLERGTYTWGVSVRDPDGRSSTVYNSTIYLIGGTNNIIAPIYISPTITTATTTVPVGDDITVFGYAIPLIPVQVIMTKQGEAQTGTIMTGTTTANGNGTWRLTLPGGGLTKGTYEIKAQSLPTTKDQSNFSPILFLGLGQDPNPDFKNRSDLNKDGKVNLVDFSILLFNWRTSDAVADINMDGNVNLTDFSIMLANWTG